MTLTDFAAHLDSFPESHVQISHLDGGLALIGVRSTYSLSNAKAKALTEHAVIHHFSHGNEGQLVEDTKALSDGSELWILGDDDASGIGALGIAACIAAESPDFTVHSLLFEDHDITPANREAWVQTLRQNPKLLEQHMKITRRGELYVRRLVHGSPDVKAVPVPSISITSSFAARGLSACFPPSVEKNQMEVNVEALGVEGISEDEPLVTFVGTVTDLGQAVTQFRINSKVRPQSWLAINEQFTDYTSFRLLALLLLPLLMLSSQTRLRRLNFLTTFQPTTLRLYLLLYSLRGLLWRTLAEYRKRLQS